MDNLETFKAIMPFIPMRYRRPLLFYIHVEEIMRIMTSLRECLNAPMTDYGGGSAFDVPGILNALQKNAKQDANSQNANMFDMLSNIKNMADMMPMMSDMMSAMNGINNTNAFNKDDSNDIGRDGAGSFATEEDFSDEIDDLFKDFLNETKGDSDE